MKLIRLSTEGDKAFFKSRFNTDVIIPADAQIALQNFTCEVDLPTLVVDAAQRGISIIVQQNGFGGAIQIQNYAAVLTTTEAPYNSSNWANLMTDIQNSLNNSVSFAAYDFLSIDDDNLNFGIEFGVGVNEALKTEIEYRYSVYNTHTSLLKLNDVNLDVTATGQYTAAGQTNGYTQAILGQIPVARGDGLWRCQLDTCNNDPGAPAGLKEQGFFIGFSRLDVPNISPSNFPTPDAPVDNNDDTIVFGVGLGFVGGNRVYYTQIGNDVVQSVVTPIYAGDGDATNDFLEIQLTGNKLFLRRYKTTADYIDDIGSLELPGFNAEHTLYPVCFFHSAVTINHLTWMPTPFEPNVNLGTQVYQNIPNDWDQLMPVPSRQQTTESALYFDTPALADFLGYSTTAQGGPTYQSDTYQGGVLQNILLANNLFTPREQEPSLMVELVSHPVESFDSKTGTRRNLLSTHLRFDANGLVRFYPQRTFLDLNNTSEINFKNVELRLVDNNYQPVAVKGVSTATLLIKSRDEAS